MQRGFARQRCLSPSSARFGARRVRSAPARLQSVPKVDQFASPAARMPRSHGVYVGTSFRSEGSGHTVVSTSAPYAVTKSDGRCVKACKLQPASVENQLRTSPKSELVTSPDHAARMPRNRGHHVGAASSGHTIVSSSARYTVTKSDGRCVKACKLQPASPEIRANQMKSVYTDKDDFLEGGEELVAGALD
eukprot:TRINITY_DN6536_c0_g1_i1.p1 TRINITY_DN6536_c0_g1~~TRINITY_DN6536_c0_g1_i1.p1  ORF type:complete len:205 (-),score=20.41 TRINITY_DN6536_c0_g1_i1:360-932(-)